MFNLNNLEIKPSPLLIAFSLVILCSGMLILFNTDLPQYIYLGMSLLGLIIALHFIAKYALLILPSSIVRCDSTEQSLYLTQKNGLRLKVMPLSSTYMSPKLLLLAWKHVEENQTGRLSHIKKHLLPANLTIITIGNVSSKEDFRRLRVLLKFGKLNAVLKSAVKTE